MIQYVRNPFFSPQTGPEFLSLEQTQPVRRFHFALDSYRETPLVPLPALAKHIGVGGIYIKDESQRFGLNAFKGLGGVYAIARVLCQKLGLDMHTITFADLQKPDLQAKIADYTFVTATDGNHGKGVAWAAGLLGCRSYVYMPKGSSEIRAENIRRAGKAQVEITPWGYDDTVRYAKKMSEDYGWLLIQDTSWPGYEEVPAWIIQGYTTMAFEAAEKLKKEGLPSPTHVFLQAGVGAMAASAAGFLANYYGEACPKITLVEPDQVACFYESVDAGDGQPHPATGSQQTIMAGLNCAEPCTIAWPILRDLAAGCLACTDDVAADGMRRLAHPLGEDPKLVSGESGASTLGALAAVMTSLDCLPIREALGLDETSVVLLFSTEGDTDPDAYRAIVEN